MLRDKSLIPLSHQHQHALALCVRVDRASPIAQADLEVWQAEIRQQFRQEITVHFAAEESLIFPAARQFPELIALVEELCGDHTLLREDLLKAESSSMSGEELRLFARRLSGHIRKEERLLFERMQQLLSAEALAELGVKLQDALRNAEQACAMPSDVTRLRPSK
jgi:hemerythrin superfamily protein